MHFVKYFRLLKIAALLLLVPVLVYSQAGKEEVTTTVTFIEKAPRPDFILYNTDKELKIKDFQGSPDMSSFGVGATHSNIQVSMAAKSMNGKTDLTVSILVYFDKSASWMKAEGKNERVLKHEQVHFDLTGIYACKMYQAIKAATFTSKNFKQKLREIQKKYTDELESEQALYDKQTKHGTLPDPQKEWAVKVTNMKSMVDCM